MHKFLLALAVLFGCLLFPPVRGMAGAGQSEVRANQGEPLPVTVFLIEGLSFERLKEWQKNPDFSAWLGQSDLGAMTMRTGGSRSIQNHILTMAAGRMMEGPEALLVARHTGSGMVIPFWEEWNRPSGIRPVLLGQMLEEAGVSRKLIAEGGIEPEQRHPGALLLSGRDGAIPAAMPEAMFSPRFMYPYGMKNDLSALKGELARAKEAFLLVELSELGRLFASWETISEPDRQRAWQQAEAAIVALILWHEQQFGHEREVWLLSSGLDPASQEKGEWLVPLVRHSPGSKEGGILVSPTTRQPGIVANVDLLPSFLSHWQIPIPGWTEGREIQARKGERLQAEFHEELAEIFHVHSTRPPLLYQVIFLQVFLLLGMALIAYFGPKRGRWPLRIGHYILCYVVLIPLWLLIIGGMAPLWSEWEIHLFLLAGGMLTGLITRRWPLSRLYGLIGFLYTAIILADGLLGNPMMKRSLLGYDPVIGARFYGIGNEYMGALVGSALLFIFLSLGRERAVLSFVLMAAVLLYLGLPDGGTNFGGTIAWLAAIILVSRSYFPEVWRGQRLILNAGGIGVLFGLVMLVHLLGGAGEQTHIGRFLHQLQSGNWAVISETVARKWEMNMRLMRISSWSKLFVTSLLVLGWFLLRPNRGRKRNQRIPAHWEQAFVTIFWVSLVNLLVNDSGVVAAAMGLLFAAVPLLHLVIRNRFAGVPVQG